MITSRRRLCRHAFQPVIHLNSPLAQARAWPRGPLVAAGWALSASGRTPGGAEAAGAALNDRPNIVLIQTDDQTYRQFSRQVMPNTKRLLANHGTTFRNYIATTAQCCPSRASLITGQYAHNDGVTSNGVGYRGLVDKGNVLPVWLQQAGYLTLHVGKFMNGYQQFADPPSLVPPGWDQWYSFLGGTRYYDYDLYVNGDVVHRGSRAAANATQVANRKAVQLIRSWASEAVPIYLQLDEPSPHIAAQQDPYGNCGHAPMPERRDEGAYRHAPLPRPPSFNERDMRDKPPFLSSAPEAESPRQTNHVRRRWRCALASLKGVDRGVAQVYRALKRARPAPAHRVHLHLGQRAVLRRAPDREGEGAPVPGGAAPSARDQGAEALPRTARRRRRERHAAGRQHRPRADDPQPRPRPAVPTQRALPDDGRALARAAADPLRAIGRRTARCSPSTATRTRPEGMPPVGSTESSRPGRSMSSIRVWSIRPAANAWPAIRSSATT